MKLYKIKKSNIDNRGLYANKNIKSGTKIIEYKGKIVTKKKVEEKVKKKKYRISLSLSDEKDYAVAFVTISI